MKIKPRNKEMEIDGPKISRLHRVEGAGPFPLHETHGNFSRNDRALMHMKLLKNHTATIVKMMEDTLSCGPKRETRII